jgi:hypothetical protein
VDFFLIKTSSYFEKTFEPTSEMERKRERECTSKEDQTRDVFFCPRQGGGLDHVG